MDGLQRLGVEVVPNVGVRRYVGIARHVPEHALDDLGWIAHLRARADGGFWAGLKNLPLNQPPKRVTQVGAGAIF
jgi:hypothetical protein